LIRNARVYTVDAQRLWAQALAVKSGQILWVGDDKDAGTHMVPRRRSWMHVSGWCCPPGGPHKALAAQW